jgi:hypothetical protein
MTQSCSLRGSTATSRWVEHARAETAMEHETGEHHPPRGSCRVGASLRRIVLLCTVVTAALALPRRADAAAGQWQAGGRAGMAWLDGPGWGPSVESFLRHGLGDSVDFDLQILTSLHPFQSDAKMASGSAPDSAPTPWALGMTPGLLYRWDVLRVIPFVGAAVGIYASDGWSRSGRGLQFGAAGRAGLEYLLSRDVVLSVQASAHFALTESPLPSPWVQLTAGAGYVWGW